MRTLVLSFVTALALFTGAAQAATVFFDDFSSYGPGDVLDAPDTLFGGVWATTGGTVDYLAPPGGYSGLCRGTGNCIDLDGSTGNSGVFSTVQTFAAGSYELSLTLLGSGRGTFESVRVTLGDFVLIFAGIDPETIESDTFAFTTTGGVLTFEALSNDNIGPLLTSVSLVSAVPLPASLPLLAAGLGLVGLMRKRRKSA